MTETTNICELPRCSWCDSLGPKHQWGYQTPEGETVTGHFCKRDCYERWLRWRSVYANIKPLRTVPPPGEGRAEA